ncbi:ABC transporter A family member 1-like isoform X2 [Sipha flava]|uniref:ABC transporter A family member 1-like isoform X2 n=2 Tax=Sipha flava TaxID=143950 RepID=A0A8B8FRJ8_9HEMI|nr:ABC transporter A family member 1-like isoform X2 [Sipha flava]XP_025412979.1 ABC transporter A family member 1-like isoform X2 [Sipha flava]XP_025412980.1 ABC transporter A family member 1-like isoform X2 [Sipha flava]
MKFAVYLEFWHQIKALTIRNVLIKRREIKKTLSEIAIPVYTLGLLVAIKLLIPNPNFPSVTVPQESPDMYNYLYGNITVAPSSKHVQIFLEKMNEIWMKRSGEKINFDVYQNKEDIFEIQRNDPAMVYVALLFEDDPIQNHSLSYKIRTNPFYDSSPSPSKLYGSNHQCRKIFANKLTKKFLHRHHHNNDQHKEEISCPAIHYIYSGFMALQTLVDITKISLTSHSSMILPNYRFVLFPKPAYTANWLMVFHMVIPLYVVIALSQFITYLLVQLVGEKEQKIKEVMKIMGLKELVFWCSWFNIYAVYVTLLSIASTAILYLLGIFNNTNWILIFLLVYFYSITVIFFSFMISPFFDKSRTAGILGNFVLNLISLMYFLHTLIDPSSKRLFWLISLISPSGFALAIDKAMTMDLSGEGLHFGNIWNGPGISFGESLLFMVFDAFIYAILAYYFDMVLPSEYERKQSPWFFLKSSFWHSKVPEVIEFDDLNRYSISNPDLEPVADSMKEFQAIKVTNLCKSFKGSTKNVINGINMIIYQGEITAILGHNGAGKTTLFNILTGLTEPTSGTIKVFGYDVRNPSDVTKIRRMIGVCPQYDILFERLTPKEHLKFFATLRGLTSEKIDDEVQKMLVELYLVDKADDIVKTLSGGQKRKLSVGIAVIGNPKIIILDEPTAGVDPPARRHLWSLLQKRKKGKVILLTTHFMDEADILADRIAVISKGCVKCCGSSIFLKNKFGIGYHLTLILNNQANENSIVKMIKEHVPNAERARRHGYELSFVLPHDSVSKFPPLFGQIETEIKSKTSSMGIENYGVSMTTLEEVFLYLEQGQHENAGKLAIELLKGPPTTDLNSRGSINSIHNVTVRSSIVYDPTNWSTIVALLKMRTKRVLRDIHKLYVMILLPIVFLATGIILNKLSHEIQPIRSLVLNYNVYKENSRLIIPSEELSNYSTLDSDLYTGSFPGLLDLPSHLGALQQFNECCSPLSLTIYYNDSFIHSLPIILNSITSNLFGSQIDIKTEPFKMEYKQNEYSFSRCSSAFFLGIVFVLVPVSLSADLVYDREIKAKNQLRINGVTFMQYFCSYFIILISMLLLIFFLLIFLIASFHVEGLDTPYAISTMIILLVAYCPAAILATACISYLFERSDSVQSILPNVTSLIGGVPFIIVASLDMLGIANDLGFALHVLFSSTNFVYIPFAIIYFINTVYRENDEHAPFIKYVNKETVALLMGCLGQIPVLWVILKILDSETKNKRTSIVTVDTQDEGDDDVKSERAKVNSIINDQVDWPVVVIQNLKKEFTNLNVNSSISCLMKKKYTNKNNERKLAIRNLSLAVNSGEVLGLLGHNGAGKTTTMRIITMEEKETIGKIFIKGHNIRESQDIAYKMIGYCPQHDALWSSLTIREHLNIYATIRGITKNQIQNIIDKYIEGLQITEHADKQVSCCSGGTRRKLSFALAMIGNPKLVLLDEPSTGMDPRSKRYLWDAIISSFQGTKGAILTTHSMEEADALCSRVGIMVKGQLRCLGSTQYLKNLYGAGYTLEIKLKPHGDMDDVKNFVITSFPNAIQEEEFADRLVFGVPQSTVISLAQCFLNLENAKNMYDIQEYSFGQTTLEQVYLKFAHYEDTDVFENKAV